MDPFIFFLRIANALAVVRFPIAGGLAAMWLDGVDWRMNVFNLPQLHANYDPVDKSLDLFTYSVEAYLSYRWRIGTARSIALGLYLLRALGNVLFLVTRNHVFLVVFPNIFEGFFLFVLVVRFLARRPVPAAAAWAGMVILAIPKLVQEYWQHILGPADWRYVPVLLPNGQRVLYDNINHQLWIGIALVAVTVLILNKTTREKTDARKRAVAMHREA